MKQFYLSINQCLHHPKFKAIMFDERDDATKAGMGVRLTPSKCCGSWDTTHSFKLDEDGIRLIIETCQEALEP